MDDLTEIFRVSAPTVNRWLRDAREGKSNFPLPINGPRRRLLWDRDAILAYLSGGVSVTSPIPKIESAAQRRKRHDAAMESLKKHGITIRK